MAHVCNKCKKAITNKQFFTCAVCNQQMHLDCTSVSFQRFRIMTAANKKAYKCSKCTSKLQSNNISNSTPVTTPVDRPSIDLEREPEASPTRLDISLPTPIRSPPKSEEQNFVTNRNKCNINISTENSFEGLCEDEELSSFKSTPKPNNLNRSCTELRQNAAYLIEELNEKICKLEQKLLTAENEIENLSSENHSLKKIISEYEVKVNKLSHICKSTSTPKVGLNKTDPNSMTRKRLNFSNKESLKKNSLSCPKNFDCQTADTSRQIKAKTVPITTTAPMNTTNLKAECAGAPMKTLINNNTKICLISSISQHKTSRLLRNRFGDLNLCHYRTPGGGISELLSGLETKLCDYTMSDYCIIILGESDFMYSKNYRYLIDNLKKKISDIKHTNILLCLPTFKLSDHANIFNKRIEIFNKLIYQDNVTHQYCYIIDSNRNIPYTFDMFLKYNGKINNKGMKIITNDIMEQISAIANYYVYHDDCIANEQNSEEHLSSLKNHSFRT